MSNSENKKLKTNILTSNEAIYLIKHQIKHQINEYDVDSSHLKKMYDLLDNNIRYKDSGSILSIKSDGKLDIERLCSKEINRTNDIIELIKNTLNYCKLKDKIIPDTKIFLYVSDVYAYEDQELPFFVLAKPKNKKGILIPDNSFNNHPTPEGRKESWEQTKSKCNETRIQDMNRKKSAYFFMGANTDINRQNLRSNLFKLSQGEGIQGTRADSSLPLHITLKGRIHISEFTNYKYLLNLPGNQPWSYRFKYLFLVSSVVINIDVRQRYMLGSPCEVNDTWINFFDVLFEPNSDYINLPYHWIENDDDYNEYEFRKLISNLKETYRLLEQKPLLYNRISNRGLHKASLITNELIYESIYELIYYYSMKLNSPLGIGEDSVNILSVSTDSSNSNDSNYDSDWIQLKSKTNGRLYWYNKVTKQSAWKLPPEEK